MTLYNMSKRHFLTGLGASAGLIGLGRPAFAAGSYGVASYDVDANTVYDVIVIGAGTAGMPLAVTAAQRGKVLVIEKGHDVGGTLFLSGGMMSAAGTALQKRKDIKDSPDMHYNDTMAMGHGKANPDVTRLFVDNAARSIDWLEEIGMKWPEAQPQLGVHAEFATRRYHGGAKGGLSIRELLMPLYAKAEAAGKIRTLLRTGAVELTQDSNKAVTGVIAEDENGKRTQYKGRNVVLTAGGCMRSKAVFDKYHPKYKLFGRAAYEHSKGQGIEIGVAAGGNVSGGDMYISHRGAILADRDYPSPREASASMDSRRRQPWEIEVNLLGKRYMAEDADIDTIERGQTEQPDMAAIVVWDQTIYDKAPPLIRGLTLEQQQARFSNGHTMFAKGDTIEEVARRLNIPPAALVETVKVYNKSVETGSDPFGRKHMPLPVINGPFYAVETHGTGVFSHAGIDINGQLQVITKEKRPIPNLYAAGEVTGGWQCAGDVVVNGCMVTPAVTFGRMLGEKMLKI
jgi:fumarate reductase flavoprotein subunit